MSHDTPLRAANHAEQLLAIDVFSELLAATGPRDLGQRLTAQLRELTGARTVLLIAHPAGAAPHTLIHACPERRATLFGAEELGLFCPHTTPTPLPHLTAQLPSAHPLREVLLRAGVESLLRIPLRVRDEIVATLVLLDLPEPGRIAEVATIVNHLAPVIALALKNAVAQAEIAQQALALQAQTAELERRVAERTAALEEANRSLAASRLSALNLMEEAVAARQRAEETSAALQHSEALFRRTFDEAPIGAAIVAPDGAFRRVNAALCHFLGYTEAELLGHNFVAITMADDLPAGRALVGRLLRGEIHAFDQEKRYLRKDGTVVWGRVSVSLVRDIAGQPLHLVPIIQDITARKQAEASLRQSEQRYATTLAAVNDGLWEWNVPDGTAYFSPLYYTMLGYRDGAFMANYANWHALVHPEDIERVEAELRHSVEAGLAFSIDLRLKTNDGAWRWVCTRGNTIESDPRGHARRMVGTLSDITRRKQAERDLERFFSLVPDMVCIASDDGRFLKLNDAWSRVLGYTKEELMAVPYSAFIHPEDLAPSRQAADAQQAGQSTTNFVNRYRAKDGSYRWLEWNGTPIKEGGILFAAARDITEHRLAEEERRRSHELLAKLAAQVPGVVYQYRIFTDGRTCFPYASPGLRDIYELEPEEVREDASPVLSRLHPDDTGFVMAAINDSARTLEPFHCEFRVMLPRQGLRWRLSDAMPERMPDGSTLWHGIISDITDRRRAEQALHASLREKEALLKEVHHRVKNNLQIISSLLRLQSDQTDHPAATGALHNMQGRIRSMALLHETLYRSGDLARVHLADYLEAVCTQLFRAHQRNAGAIDLRLDLAAFELDATQAVPCGLLVNELVANALKHAFPAGRAGLVHVELQVLPLPPATGSAPGQPQSPAGVKLRLAVTDDGVGLPAGLDVKTLRSLGLQLVSDLARQLQGTLAFGPGAERGAAFALEFIPKVVSPPPGPLPPS